MALEYKQASAPAHFIPMVPFMYLQGRDTSTMAWMTGSATTRDKPEHRGGPGRGGTDRGGEGLAGEEADKIEAQEVPAKAEEVS